MSDNKKIDLKVEKHALLSRFFDKYKLPEEFKALTEIFLGQIYGNLVFSYALGLVDSSALDKFQEEMESNENSIDYKTGLVIKIIKDHSDVELEEFYDNLVKIFIHRMEKNLKTVVSLYNKSIQMSDSQEQLEKNFSDYMQSMTEMRFRSLDNLQD